MEEKITTKFEKMVTLAASKAAAREAQEIIVKSEPINLVKEGQTDRSARKGQKTHVPNQHAVRFQYQVACTDRQTDDITLFNMYEQFTNCKPYTVQVFVNDVPVEFQIDSGSSVICISELLFFKQFKNISLCSTNSFSFL